MKRTNGMMGVTLMVLAATAIAGQAAASYTSADAARRRANDARIRRAELPGHRATQRAVWGAERPHPRYLDGCPLERA